MAVRRKVRRTESRGLESRIGFVAEMHASATRVVNHQKILQTSPEICTNGKEINERTINCF